MNAAVALQLDKAPELARTREGLSQADLRVSYALSDAVGAAYLPKPSIEEMAAWVDDQETRMRASAFIVSSINGFIDPAHARSLAIARKLLDFLGLCHANEEELATMFRAIAHREKRGR